MADWVTIAAVVTIIGLPVAIIGVIVNYLPTWKARRSEKIMERSFGADSFDSEQIKAALECYVDPDCSVFDPSGEDDIRQVVPNRAPLFDTIDEFLSEKHEGKHVLLLADSGMGKTSFLLNYYARNLQKRKHDRKRIAVIPLGRPKVISKIEQIDNKKETVVMLDAFDEDTKAILDHRERLQQLMDACADFKRVVLTCRTQFFASDEEIPKETGVAIVGPRKAGEGRIYKFYKLYLSPFTDTQIRGFLRKHFPVWQFHKRKEALRIINAIPELSVRPMLLVIVPTLIEKKRLITELYELYEFMVESWLERESSWINKDILRGFSESLAVDIYRNRVERGMERISLKKLSELIRVELSEIERWKLTARSLLNRDAEGNYKFAHRSIMEYLYVTAFIKGGADCLNEEWTDLMKELFISWASHQSRENDSQISQLLQMSDFSRTGIFPLFERGREPQLLKRSETLTSSVSRRVRSRYSRINAKWSTAFVVEDRNGDMTTFYDMAYDLKFSIPVDNRCGNSELMSLFQISPVDMERENKKGKKSFRAPTLDEFDLLYIINEGIPFADPFGYYWSSDWSEGNRPLCVVFGAIKEEEVDTRLKMIGQRQPEKEKANVLGYTVFELNWRTPGFYENPPRGYAIRVSDAMPYA